VSHLLMGIVAVLAFVLNYLALQDRESTLQVAIADRPLSAGALLSIDDVRLVPVPSDYDGLGSMLTEEELGSPDGWVLERAVPADGVIGQGALVQPGAPSGLRAMSIPSEIEHAAGGGVVPGDRVDVISTSGDEAVYVVSDIEVIAVADPSSAAFGAIGAYHIVVAVDSEQALLIAAAIEDGSVEILRSTGAEPIDGAGD
ncbi:MAG: hypothetical protein KY394_07825, partial [Actinobacteria bacterium]|nr:hypothetical protein [Actinomycetota bacterium]